MPGKTKIIFIAAHSRSGSTLLDRALGQEKDFFSIGELRYLWERNIIEDQLCGCNTKFSKCDFWKEVINDSFGTVSRSDADHNIKLFRMIHSKKTLPQICWPILRSKTYQKHFDEWGEIMKTLYSSIAKISGSKYLVDSSKTPSYGILLQQLFGENLFVVHLVRDPRAVAYSRIRKKKRPEVHWKQEFMAVTPPGKTAFQWMIFNILCEILNNRSEYARINYEDFINEPYTHITSLVNKITNEKRTLSFIEQSKLTLDPAHTASGNPMRFKVGEVELVPDMEWTDKLSTTNKLFISIVCWPLVLKYYSEEG